MKTYVLHVSRFAVAAITMGWTATAFTADLHRDAAAAPPSQWATGHANQLARVAVPARSRVPLTITSPAFKDGGDMPRENTQYGANIFPGLGWSKGPDGTKSYVVIVQGDATSGSATSIHLTLFNVPASMTKLVAGMATAPSGATYGPNVHGLNQPYAGPHPHTAARQRYHLQVFALDTTLGSDPPVSLEALESAMTGHVLASGELVGVAAGEPGMAQAQVPSPETPSTQRISADLITRADALKIADASITACERQGEKVAAMVSDADGFLRAALSSDGGNPIGLRSASLKTATVLKFKASTRSLEERLKSDAAFAAEYGKDTHYFYHPGGMAIYRDGKFVAVLAVGGGHDKDESCALEALKLLPWAKTNP